MLRNSVSIICLVLIGTVWDVIADRPFNEVTCLMECMKFQICSIKLLSKQDCIEPEKCDCPPLPPIPLLGFPGRGK